jgi:arabinogalactan oligomer/maltooligosaccharide transport system substrate-binding protein
VKRNNPFITLLTLLIGASVILTACGDATATAPTPTSAQDALPTTPLAPTAALVIKNPEAIKATGASTYITIWHQWDGTDLAAISQAFKDYEATHPGVTIELSKPDDIAGALSTASKSGTGPDIISWSSDQIGEQALHGNIIALNELGVTPAYLQSTYEPAAAKGVAARGKIYALPETQETLALIYNKDTVGDKYLPKNLTDLLDKAKAYQQDTGKVLVCNEGFSDPDALRVAPIYFGFGVPAYIDETGKDYVGTPEMLKGAEWLASMAKVSLRQNNRGACSAGLKDGAVGMWWTGPWAIGDIEANGVNYGILPMGKPFVSLKVMMIGKNAPDRKTDKAALDIIKYFTSADVQKRLAVANRTIPAAIAALKSAEIAKLLPVSGFATAAEAGVPMSTSPYARAQWDPVGLASALVWVGAQKPAEAMADAEKQIKAAIGQMK